MRKEPQHSAKKSLFSTYIITVEGMLPENWADWFNGMLIDFEYTKTTEPQTIITCKTRDQAELNGILNWLHSMNLRLVEVIRSKGVDGL